LAGASFAGTNEPVYIGDEDEGIELGPLQEKPVVAEVVKANGHTKKIRPLPRPVSQPDEPIAKAFVRGWRGFVQWWNHGRMATPLKVGLLLLVAILAIFNHVWLIPAAVGLACVYLVYLGIRMITRALGAAPAAALPAADLRHVAWSPAAREQQGRQVLGMKTAGDRIGELTGSMLAAAAIALVLTIVITAIGGESLDDSRQAIAGPAWLWLMTTVGSWLILASGKFFERNSGDEARRRFAMLVLGLVFGAIAFGTSRFLMVEMHDGVANSGLGIDFVGSMYGPDGAPRIAAFLAYFGSIFLTVGWWKQTDPLRSSRLKLGPILVVIFAAWAWWMLWAFPQPWGFMLVAAISITTQLSAPWLRPSDQAALARQGQNPFAR
jgi:hypothetical protein